MQNVITLSDKIMFALCLRQCLRNYDQVILAHPWPGVEHGNCGYTHTDMLLLSVPEINKTHVQHPLHSNCKHITTIRKCRDDVNLQIQYHTSVQGTKFRFQTKVPSLVTNQATVLHSNSFSWPQDGQGISQVHHNMGRTSHIHIDMLQMCTSEKCREFTNITSGHIHHGISKIVMVCSSNLEFIVSEFYICCRSTMHMTPTM